MNAIELFSSAAGKSVVDEDGNAERIQLMPPVTESELATIERELGFALPTEARALLRMTSGLAGTALDQFQFVDVSGQDLPDLFPHPLSIAHDGFGNFWIVDLWPSSERFGPVFYVAHDPAVVVYQCEDVATFAQHVLEFSNPPHAGPIDEVHENAASRVWAQDTGVRRASELSSSEDAALRTFASKLPADASVVDLRRARTGDGFAWARFGPHTPLFRHGAERLFAYGTRTRAQRLRTWWSGRP